jgi:hypothetical protein
MSSFSGEERSQILEGERQDPHVPVVVIAAMRDTTA